MANIAKYILETNIFEIKRYLVAPSRLMSIPLDILYNMVLCAFKYDERNTTW